MSRKDLNVVLALLAAKKGALFSRATLVSSSPRDQPCIRQRQAFQFKALNNDTEMNLLTQF